MLKVTNGLVDEIIKGQRLDPLFSTQSENIAQGKESSFSLGQDEVLKIQDNICVPNP